MPVFNINSLSTVGGLRKSFKKQFGGTLHVRYNGVLVHNYSNDLALIGGKSGTINYSNQTTVDAFEKDVLNICNLHVKVCTPDEWIEVLGPIKLGTVKDYPIRTNREMMDYSLTNNIQTVGNKYKGSLPNGYTPSVNDLLWYQEKREGLSNYYEQEQALNLLFRKLPQNKKLSQILLKTAALNDFYSTNIFDIYTVARHIYELHIDNRLAVGKENLVNVITRNKFTNIATTKFYSKNINFYSFATKYCSHHKPDNYPIYDHYVCKSLKALRKLKTMNFRNDDLKDYKSFKSIIDYFASKNQLINPNTYKPFSYKLIDNYLWLLGKDYFLK